MGSFPYYVDIVFCVDVSEGMMPVMDQVKRTICSSLDDLRHMEAGRDHELVIRARVIVFRDYLEDGNRAMQATNFFELPQQNGEFWDTVNSITAEGGGVASSQDGLEAIAYAIKATPWKKHTPRSIARRRQVIVVFSNNPAHPLGYGARSPYYPKGMARDFDELTSWWGNRYAPGLMDEYAKRMILFTPDAPGWREIRNNWNKVLHYQSDAGDGLPVCDYDAILSIICEDP